MAELSGRSSDGQIVGIIDGQQMVEEKEEGGGPGHTCVLCSHAHIHTAFVCGCAYMHAYMSRRQVCAYTRSHVCVQASASVYFCSPKTHSHLNAGDRTHLPAL